MSTTQQETILNQNIHHLSFSEQFLGLCENLKIENLAQLLTYRSWELLKLEGFDVRMLHEYVLFMEEQKLAHLIRD